jgi:hypothetical protein
MSSCSASEGLKPRRGKGDRRVAFFFCLLLLLLAGCSGEDRGGAGRTVGAADEAPPWRGPVVVFCFDVMRADQLAAFGGPAGLTPALDRFAANADWQGRAVAASSNPLVAMASLFTGTGALQHRLLGHLHAKLRPGLPILAELFWEQQFDTVFFEPRPPYLYRYGLTRGMARTEDFRDEQVAHELPLFDQLPRFYWIQLPEADAPYSDRRGELPGTLPAPSRELLGAGELLPYADPAKPLPAGLERAAAELFRLEVAAGDARFGRLIAGLEGSAGWDEALVVVTALVGSELGEHGGALYGQNLYRESIEVPLLIRLPRSFAGRGLRIAEDPGAPVAAERLFATLAEAIGQPPPPIVSPSLFRRSRQPALSALMLGNGTNLFSAVAPAAGPGLVAEQLIRKSRFAPSEESFYTAQAIEAGARLELSEPPRRLFERLRDGFEHATPWRSGEVELAGFGWRDPAGTAPLDAPERLELLGRRLELALFRQIDAERTSDQEDLLIGEVEQALGDAGGDGAKDENGGGGAGESTPGGAGR